MPRRDPKMRKRLALLERLEDRCLLAAVTGDRGRVASDLLSLNGTQALVASQVANVPPATNSLMFDDFGRVATRITAGNVNAIVPLLRAQGDVVIAADVKHHAIDAWVSASHFAALDSWASQGLLGAVPIYRPQGAAGSVANQASQVLESDRVIATAPGNFDGSGITVGVLSDSFNRLGGAAADVASGDLPAVQVIKEGPVGSADEGRAMLQLVHDVAPGAELKFAAGAFGEQDFGNQIRALAAAGAEVIADDYFYFEEPMYQDGVINQAIDDVVAGGATYFSLAGNLERQAYESASNIAFGADNIAGIAGSFYDFNPGALLDTRQNISIPVGQTVRLTMQWDDPWFTTSGVDTDLDIFLVQNNVVVASSERNSLLNQIPSEFVEFTNNTGSVNFEVVIQKIAGPNPGQLKYVNFGRNNFAAMSFNEYGTNSPTAISHAGAKGAIGVGAVPYYDQLIPEVFTSAGPTTFLFAPDGTRLAFTDVRQTPHISAVDGTNTTFFGTDSTIDADRSPNFFGTSAAVSHAAAVAAIMLDADPTLTPAQIKARLQATARDIDVGGFDSRTGAGVINAFDAVYSLAASPLNFSETFSSGALNHHWETLSSGNGRVRVLNSFPGTTNNWSLILDTMDYAASNGSRNEAILHLDASRKSNVQLRLTQREFTDEDHAMPASFVGSSNSDGIALSVDGLTWFRILSLTGVDSKETFQTRTFNLSDIAAANGITLGADVRIKFQQFDNNSIDAFSADGMAFDNIQVTGKDFSLPPVIANMGAAGVYQEGKSPLLLSAAATVTDSDSPNFSGGALTLKYNSGGTAADLLSIRNQGTGANQISVAGTTVKFGNAVIGTFVGGTGTTPLVVNLNASATAAAVQTLVRNIQFSNSSDTPSTTARFVRVTLTDGDGGTSTPVAKRINVSATNDRPTIASFGDTISYVKGSPAITVTTTAVVSDVDSLDFASGVFTANLVGVIATDELAIRSLGTGANQISVDGSSVLFEGTEIGTFQGGTASTPLTVRLNATATAIAMNALLRAITYRNLDSSVAAGSRNVRFSITDGDGGDSGYVVKRINVR